MCAARMEKIYCERKKVFDIDNDDCFSVKEEKKNATAGQIGSVFTRKMRGMFVMKFKMTMANICILWAFKQFACQLNS